MLISFYLSNLWMKLLYSHLSFVIHRDHFTSVFSLSNHIHANQIPHEHLIGSEKHSQRVVTVNSI